MYVVNARCISCLVATVLAASVGFAAAADTPPFKTPVPTDAALKAATELVRDVYKADFERARTPIQKCTLARKLLAEGIETHGDPAGRFAIFNLSRDLATGAGDLDTALKAVDEMGNSYAVDVLQRKADTLEAVAKMANVPGQWRTLLERANEVVDLAVDADRYELAKHPSAVAIAVARQANDPRALNQVLARARELDDLQGRFAKVKEAEAQLEKSPADAAANLTAGKFLCLRKGDWKRGLPMLVLSGDPKLAELAERELANPPTAEDQAKLGDEWWDIVDDGGTPARVRAHAVGWYIRALPGLKGLAKARIEKRVQETAVAEPERPKTATNDAAGVAMDQLFGKTRAAITTGRVTESEVVGSQNGERFRDVTASDGTIVGCTLSTAKFGRNFQYSAISLIQPLYLTSKGLVEGQRHGRVESKDFVVRAKPGYAIGAIKVTGNGRIVSMQFTFMKIEGEKLNPKDAYLSEIYGDKDLDANSTAMLSGKGKALVGLTGYWVKELHGLGVIYAP